jgi:hypothetical protein
VTATVYAIRSVYVDERRNFSVFAHCERAMLKLSARIKSLIYLRTTFVTGPNTLGVVSTQSGYSSESSSMRGVLFGTLKTFYFQQNTSPYISHGTDTMMTHYDTGGTEIP